MRASPAILAILVSSAAVARADSLSSPELEIGLTVEFVAAASTQLSDASKAMHRDWLFGKNGGSCRLHEAPGASEVHCDWRKRTVDANAYTAALAKRLGAGWTQSAKPDAKTGGESRWWRHRDGRSFRVLIANGRVLDLLVIGGTSGPRAPLQASRERSPMALPPPTAAPPHSQPPAGPPPRSQPPAAAPPPATASARPAADPNIVLWKDSDPIELTRQLLEASRTQFASIKRERSTSGMYATAFPGCTMWPNISRVDCGFVRVKPREQDVVPKLDALLGKGWHKIRQPVMYLGGITVEWKHADGRSVMLSVNDAGGVHGLSVTVLKPIGSAAGASTSPEVANAVAYAEAARTGFGSLKLELNRSTIGAYEIDGCTVEAAHRAAVLRCPVPGKPDAGKLVRELGKALGKGWKAKGAIHPKVRTSAAGWRHKDGRVVYVETAGVSAKSIVVVASRALAVPAAPPRSARTRKATMCVIERGAVTMLPVEFDEGTGFIYHQGKALAETHSFAGYATARSWLIEGTPIYGGYTKSRLPTVLGPNDLKRIGAHDGISIFAEITAGKKPERIYVPIAPYCGFQPYERTK